jgi:sterol O-acyltransferase
MSDSGKKVFRDQDSLLTPVLASRSGKFITATYINIFFWFFLYHFVYYFIDGGKSWEEDRTFLNNSFQSLDIGVGLWLFYHFLLLLIMYPTTKYWLNSLNKSAILPLTVVSIVSGVILSATLVIILKGPKKVGPATRIFLSMESIRLCMKIIAFTIEATSSKNQSNSRSPIKDTNSLSNGERVALEATKTGDTQNQQDMSLKHFIYFLFAPTLLYRPSYPMRSERDWSLFSRYCFIIFTLVCFTFKISEKASIPLRDLGIKTISLKDLITQVYWVGWLLLITSVCNVAYQEIWSNIWSEVTRFGDRRFYSDWYHQETQKKWFTKFNTIVQEWLFEYVYLKPRRRYGKFAGMISVYLVSAIGHDYLLMATTGMFIPIYLITFSLMTLSSIGVGNPPVRIRHDLEESEGQETTEEQEVPSLGKYFGVTGGVVFGVVLFFPLMLEFYSRENCESKFSPLADFFIPRFPFCVSIST